jgi:SHS2 domain-containing protein
VFTLRRNDCWGVDVTDKGVHDSNYGPRFETFEHKADIGIRGFGDTLENAFENAASAMYSVMVNIDAVKQLKMRTVTVSASDIELLLVEWLNGLLSLSDIEKMVFSKFKVIITDTSLNGTVWGEPLDRRRHDPNVEVKGATYHMLNVIKYENGKYVAQCVVDV